MAILLAAGAGSRFGGDKLLHPLPDGAAIGVCSARNLVRAGMEVTAVIKPGDERLAELLRQEGCVVTVCARAAAGMGASLAHGVGLCRDADGWVIALADMPAISLATIWSVVEELSAGRNLVAPIYQGRRGHPVGMGSTFRDQLLSLDGDVGARDIISAHRAELELIAVDDPGILRDIDRREDL